MVTCSPQYAENASDVEYKQHLFSNTDTPHIKLKHYITRKHELINTIASTFIISERIQKSALPHTNFRVYQTENLKISRVL